MVIFKNTAQHKNGKRTRSYVEEAFRQISEKSGVLDIIILNRFGNAVKTTMTTDKTLEVKGLIGSLCYKVENALHQIDSKDELIMLRVASHKNETIFTPDGNISIIVTQKANDCFQK